MKNILLITLSVLSFNIFAEDNMKAENFGKLKEMMLTNIDKRISLIQEHKSCVSSATEKEALKACREKNKESMKALKSDRKAMHEHFKDEKKSHREEKKNKKK